MLIVFTNKPITTHIFGSWSISVMILSINDCRKSLLNHAQSLSLSKLTTCTIEVTSSLSVKKANSQPSPASFSYNYGPEVQRNTHVTHMCTFKACVHTCAACVNYTCLVHTWWTTPMCIITKWQLMQIGRSAHNWPSEHKKIAEYFIFAPS